VEVAATLEDLQKLYTSLVKRVAMLPAKREHTEDYGDRRGVYMEREVEACIKTDDKKIPELRLYLHTAHKLNDEESYDHTPGESLYIIAEWRAPGVGQYEMVNSPICAEEGQINLVETGRTLGLIEESILEAEQVLIPVVE
jgi:hypothetical protein